MKFDIYTWGSCRKSLVEILYPEKINLAMITNKPGKNTIETPFGIIEYSNYDSRRNLDRQVKITPKAPVIIRHYGAGSCNPSSYFDDVYLVSPDETVKLDVKEEITTEETSDYIIKTLQKYIIYNDQKIIIDKTTLEKKRKKYQISIMKTDDKYLLCGDTFFFKETFKKHGFKWDPITRCWKGDNIEKILNELPENVEIKE